MFGLSSLDSKEEARAAQRLASADATLAAAEAALVAAQARRKVPLLAPGEAPLGLPPLGEARDAWWLVRDSAPEVGEAVNDAAEEAFKTGSAALEAGEVAAAVALLEEAQHLAAHPRLRAQVSARLAAATAVLAAAQTKEV